MKRAIFCLFILFSLASGGQVTFKKVYNTPAVNEHFSDQLVFDDSTIVLAARGDNHNTYLVRTDLFGDTLWTRTYKNNSVVAMSKSADGAFVFAGRLAFAQGQTGFGLAKMNKSGQVLWSRGISHFSDTTWYNRNLSDISPTADKGFLLAGDEELNGSQDYGATLRKVDSLGQVQWGMALDVTNQMSANSALELPNGDVVVSGHEYVYPNRYVVLFKVDSAGNFKWLKHYSSSDVSMPYDLTADNNGYLYVVGNLYSTKARGLLMKFDTSGALLTARVFEKPGLQTSFSSVSVINGHLLITGVSLSSTDELDGVLIKANLNCDTVFTRSINSNNAETLFSLSEAPSGGYVIAGERKLTSALADIMVTVTDTMGKTTCTWSPNPMVVSGATLTVSAMSPTVLQFGGDFIAPLDPFYQPRDVQSVCAPCAVPPPPADATPIQRKTVCVPNSATLSATSPGNIHWFASATSPTPLASGSTFITSSLPKGQYTYFASAETCASSSVRTPVSFTVSDCTALIESIDESEVVVMPNPSQGMITVTGHRQCVLTILSVMGETVYSRQLGEGPVTIDVGDQAGGVYLLVFTDGKGHQVTRMVILE